MQRKRGREGEVADQGYRGSVSVPHLPITRLEFILSPPKSMVEATPSVERVCMYSVYCDLADYAHLHNFPLSVQVSNFRTDARVQSVPPVHQPGKTKRQPAPYQLSPALLTKSAAQLGGDLILALSCAVSWIPHQQVVYLCRGHLPARTWPRPRPVESHLAH